MKRNYVAPQISLCRMYADVITASTPETYEGFDKNWID